jgi:hypothetical protein
MCIALLVAGAAAVSGCARAESAPALANDVAVFTEMSDSMKKVAPGWNTRVFNFNEVPPQTGSAISVDANGVVTLQPGTYHITASSAVTYDDLDPKPSSPGWNTKERPNAGYARLRYTKDPVTSPNEKAIIVGTISNSNMVPSLIDTYLAVPAGSTAVFVLEHQVGDEQLDQIYLQDNTGNSKWHVFARIAIRRL